MRYELIRSSRKTLALTVDRDGKLTVRAPLRTPLVQIEAFLTEKRGWVEKTLRRLAALPPKAEPFGLKEGAQLPYLGEIVTVRFSDVARVSLRDGALLVPFGTQEPAPVVRFLEAQARRELTARVGRLSQAVGLYPKTIRLTRAKGRWGSMSGRGTLSLNRALIHCPPEVIDYVVIHELCHIRQPNHSPAFWALVEQCLPDYRHRRDWLKARNHLISVLPA